MEAIPASNNTIYVDTINARVGISTASPQHALDVAGSIRFSSGLAPGGDPGTQGYILVSSGAGAAPTWQPMPSAARYNFYLSTNAADVSGFSQLTSTNYPTITTSTYANAVNGVVISTNITNVGVPQMAQMPQGQLVAHLHSAQTSGTKATSLQAQFWEATSTGGLSALIATTDQSAALVSANQAYDLTSTLSSPYTFASTSSRIAITVILVVAGGGSAPTVQVYMGNGQDSRAIFPGLTADVSRFVPYSGALQDVNIGNHNLTGTSSMTASAFFGDGSHLSGISPSGSAGGDLTGTYPNPTFDLTKSHTWSGAQNLSGGSVIGVQSQTANQAVFGTDGRLWIGNNTDSGGTMKKSSLSVQSNSALNPFDFRDTRQDGITYNFVVTTMGVVGIQTGSPDQTTALDVSGPAVIRSSLTVVGSSVTASAFFGDGSHLTGLSAGGNVSTLGTPSAGRGAMFSGATTISTASFYDNGAGAITVPSGSSATFNGPVQISSVTNATLFLSSQAFSASSAFTLGIGLASTNAVVNCTLAYTQNTSLGYPKVTFNSDTGSHYHYTNIANINTIGAHATASAGTAAFAALGDTSFPPVSGTAATFIFGWTNYSQTITSISGTGFWEANATNGEASSAVGGSWANGAFPATITIKPSAGTMTGLMKCAYAQ